MTWTYTLEEIARIAGVEKPVRDATIHGVSTDTRTLRSGDLFFALRGPNHDGLQFARQALEKGASGVVGAGAIETGPCLVVPDPLKVLQDWAASHRARFSGPLIAITGSCGKTTAKDLTAAVLGTKYRVVKTQGNLNNEIGCPLSLLRLDSGTEAAVVEMGANHPGEIAALCRMARPTESAVTMVGPAHLEGFGSVEQVAAAKAEIMEALGEEGCFYVNMDDPRCVFMGDRFTGEKTRFGSSGDVVLKDCRFEDSGEMRLDISPIGTLHLPLAVRAHATNVLLAVAVGLRHGITEFEGSLREACHTATRFHIRRIGPIEVLDDTYNANPSSMAAALEALSERPVPGVRMAVLGAMLELGETAAALHRETGECAGRHGVTHLFARGPHAEDLVTGAKAAGVPHAEVIGEHQAMADAVRAAGAGGGVLLVKGSRGMQMEKVIEALEGAEPGKNVPPGPPVP